MSTYNDAKLAGLERELATTGNIDDLYETWLAARVSVPDGLSVDDLELQFLQEQLGVTEGITIQDGWRDYIIGLGVGHPYQHINDLLFIYWDAIATAPVVPTAEFSSNLVDGYFPLNVLFIDLSDMGGGDPADWEWAWTFGDTGTSSERNPLHTYAGAGTYTVGLTVTNSAGVDLETKVDYITVGVAPTVFPVTFTNFVDSSESSPGVLTTTDFDGRARTLGGVLINDNRNAEIGYPFDILDADVRFQLGLDRVGAVINPEFRWQQRNEVDRFDAFHVNELVVSNLRVFDGDTISIEIDNDTVTWNLNGGALAASPIFGTDVLYGSLLLDVPGVSNQMWYTGDWVYPQAYGDFTSFINSQEVDFGTVQKTIGTSAFDAGAELVQRIYSSGDLNSYVTWIADAPLGGADGLALGYSVKEDNEGYDPSNALFGVVATASGRLAVYTEGSTPLDLPNVIGEGDLIEFGVFDSTMQILLNRVSIFDYTFLAGAVTAPLIFRLYLHAPNVKIGPTLFNTEGAWNASTIFSDVVASYPMNFMQSQATLRNAGLRALDFTDNENDGAMNTGIALVGDGVADYVRVPHDAAQTPPGDFHIRAVFSSTNTTSNEYIAAQYDTGANRRSWAVVLQSQIIQVRLSDNGGADKKIYQSVETYADGLLHVVDVDWVSASPNGSLRIYVDGVEITYVLNLDTDMVGVNSLGADITLFSGLTNDVSNQWGQHNLSDFQFWFKSLTQAEQQWAIDHPEKLPSDARGSTLNPAATSQGGDLMCHYKADEAIGDAATSPVYDRSGNNYHGENDSNGATWLTDAGFPAPQVINTGFSRVHLFDGVDDGVSMSNGSAPATMSMLAVITNPGTGSGNGRVFRYGKLVLQITNATAVEYVITGGTGFAWTSISDVDLLVGSHTIIVAQTGTTASLYINGRLISSETVSAINTDSDVITIGISGANFCRGIVNQASMFNVLLSDKEAAECQGIDLLNHSRAADIQGYWINEGKTIWDDKVGSNDGTVAGSPVSINLPSIRGDGTLHVFDGVSDVVTGSGTFANLNQTYFVSVNCPDKGGNQRYFKYGRSWIQIRSTDGAMAYSPDGATNTVFAPTTVDLFKGQHEIAVTQTGLLARLYIDGVFIEELPAVVPNLGADNWQIGNANLVKGVLFNAAYFEVALNDAEIAELGNGENILNHSRVSELIFYTKNKGNADDSWDDLVGTKHGTVTGTPALIHDSRGTAEVKDVSGLPLTRPRAIEIANTSMLTGQEIRVPDAVSIQNIWDGGGGVSFWTNPHSLGGTNLGRIISKSWLINFRGVDRSAFAFPFSGAQGEWRFNNNIWQGFESWHCVTIAYDSDSDANNPIFYLDGATTPVNIQTAPVGTRTTDAGIDVSLLSNAGGTLVIDAYLDEVIMQTSLPTLQDHIDFFNATKGAYIPET